MSEVRPYLTLDERAAYLVDKGYADPGEVTASAREFLAKTNFHYFLGYARNFRKLRSQGLVTGDDRIDRIVELIALDHQVSMHLFAALRTVEWRLRASLVESHCAMYPPEGCFVDPSHYTVMTRDATPVHVVLQDQIRRTREPYLLGRFKAHEVAGGRPWNDSAQKMAEADSLDVMKTLPIWAVVDGFSLGVLGRAVTEAAPTPEEPERWLWKDVANCFDIANPIFHAQLSSMVVLRNFIAHHSRLWMRPTTLTPRAPKIYAKRARVADPKSMYVAWLTLASFLKTGGGDRAFLDELDALICKDPLYELGVKRPLTSAD